MTLENVPISTSPLVNTNFDKKSIQYRRCTTGFISGTSSF